MLFSCASRVRRNGLEGSLWCTKSWSLIFVVLNEHSKPISFKTHTTHLVIHESPNLTFGFMCFPGKIHTPGLHVNGSLTLAIGSMMPLDFSLLNVQDQDGRVEDLLFHVVSTPTNGQLMLSRNGKEVQLDKAGHFSWKDVNEKKVRFVHSREKPR